MSAQRGRDLLLEIAGDDGKFLLVAGLRMQRILFGAEPVESTHAQSGRWRELLAGAGLRRVGVSGAGIFKDSASDELMRKTFFAGAIRNWRIASPNFGVVEGPFDITRLEWRGESAGEIEFEIALESAGALSFAPA